MFNASGATSAVVESISSRRSLSGWVFSSRARACRATSSVVPRRSVLPMIATPGPPSARNRAEPTNCCECGCPLQLPYRQTSQMMQGFEGPHFEAVLATRFVRAPDRALVGRSDLLRRRSPCWRRLSPLRGGGAWLQLTPTGHRMEGALRRRTRGISPMAARTKSRITPKLEIKYRVKNWPVRVV